MTDVLIILTLPEPVRNRYYDHIRTIFPQLTVTMVDHVTKADPYIGSAEVLVTFGAQIGEHADALFRKASKLRWIQALGTGVDNLADQPNLSSGVWLTAATCHASSATRTGRDGSAGRHDCLTERQSGCSASARSLSISPLNAGR